MPRIPQRLLAWALTGCLLLLNGLVYPQTVAHAAHHAHHSAATHATALCSLVCAAGQALQGIAFFLQCDRHPYTRFAAPAALTIAQGVQSVSSSRGPPHFSA